MTASIPATLFILTADEGDHFAGGPPLNPRCDGVTVPCTYTPGSTGPNTVGEILTNIQALLGQEDPTLDFTKTPFDIHFDMAPVFYISGQPARNSAIARQFERDTAALTAVNPRTGNTDMLTRFLADPVELKLLHMITGDPLRTPTFVMFGDPDYFFQTFVPAGSPNVGVNPAFAWNHGGVAPEINTTFLALAGPGVQNKGVTNSVWSDHTDIRPTLLGLLGLRDDYRSQGRALAEDLQRWALPEGVSGSGDEFVELARAYKRINAPVGELGLASLKISTAALAGDDATYNSLENRLQLITIFRDALAARMLNRLEDAELHGQRISDSEERALVLQANALVDSVNWLAAHTGADH
jgi:arylsulfatase A-like enzyme